MIVVMQSESGDELIERVVAQVKELGLSPQVIRGTHQTVVAAIGEERPGLVEALEPMPGVEKVLPIMDPYKRASRELRSEPTVVTTLGLSIGGKSRPDCRDC
jgi:3-deoxy-7-phosphoheptulonate synthase